VRAYEGVLVRRTASTRANGLVAVGRGVVVWFVSNAAPRAAQVARGRCVVVRMRGPTRTPQDGRARGQRRTTSRATRCVGMETLKSPPTLVCPVVGNARDSSIAEAKWGARREES